MFSAARSSVHVSDFFLHMVALTTFLLLPSDSTLPSRTGWNWRPRTISRGPPFERVTPNVSCMTIRDDKRDSEHAHGLPEGCSSWRGARSNPLHAPGVSVRLEREQLWQHSQVGAQRRSHLCEPRIHGVWCRKPAKCTRVTLGKQLGAMRGADGTAEGLTPLQGWTADRSSWSGLQYKIQVPHKQVLTRYTSRLPIYFLVHSKPWQSPVPPLGGCHRAAAAGSSEVLQREAPNPNAAWQATCTGGTCASPLLSLSVKTNSSILHKPYKPTTAFICSFVLFLFS